MWQPQVSLSMSFTHPQLRKTYCQRLNERKVRHDHWSGQGSTLKHHYASIFCEETKKDFKFTDRQQSDTSLSLPRNQHALMTSKHTQNKNLTGRLWHLCTGTIQVICYNGLHLKQNASYCKMLYQWWEIRVVFTLQRVHCTVRCFTNSEI